MAEGVCDGCQRRAELAPLHGPEKGGPLRCYVCIGAWHAEHGRKRKLGRVVIRAMIAFLDGGGSLGDIEKLKLAALAYRLFNDVDPLGYMAETATTRDETVLMTSELLAEALRLCHPDRHPPERRDLANRVTQQLLALQPFVFPAPRPKSVPPSEPCHGSLKSPAPAFKEPSQARYPCVDCASTVPLHYCTSCRVEFERRRRAEQDRVNAKQRAQYARRKARRARFERRPPCAACGNDMKGKRKDARFCSPTCRQRNHLTSSRNCLAVALG